MAGPAAKTFHGDMAECKTTSAAIGVGGPNLLDRMRAARRSRHYSRRTEQTYYYWLKRHCHFHNVRHPNEIAEPEINTFLKHFAVNEKVSASTQNQAFSTLLFFYRHVLAREIGGQGKVIRMLLLRL